jgi:predicted nucleic acid-binding Zn ribbon protein
MVALGAALLMRLLSPISGFMAKGRCIVCGHLTERGHTYCLDHLQETVNSGRDQARDRSTSARGDRAGTSWPTRRATSSAWRSVWPSGRRPRRRRA